MTNHFRTLLMNLAARSGSALPGDEFVDPAFVPSILPASLQAVQTAVFGPSPDRVGMNLTMARLLAYLYSSQLAQDVLLYDSRISYDPRKPVDVWTSLGVNVLTFTGPTPLAWQGTASFPNVGRSYGEWLVATDGLGDYTTTTYDGVFQRGQVVATGTGDVIPLDGSLLSLVVPINAEGIWQVTLLVPPQNNFISAANLSVGSGVFDASASVEDANWLSIWNDGSLLAPLRVCALALAAVARLNANLVPPASIYGISGTNVIGAPAIVTPPAIFGPPIVGWVLTVIPAVWSGVVARRAWTWFSGSSQVGTGSTYVPVTGDVGNLITVQEIATGPGGPSLPSTSTAVGPVVEPAPAPTVVSATVGADGMTFTVVFSEAVDI